MEEEDVGRGEAANVEGDAVVAVEVAEKDVRGEDEETEECCEGRRWAASWVCATGPAVPRATDCC